MNLELGEMIGMLGGNEETVAAVKQSVGKVIKSAAVSNDRLSLEFEGGGHLILWDGGQSCCEHRHMSSDADLSYFGGAALLKIEVTDALTQNDNYGNPHEIQFLDIHTSRGMFQVANHNEHNGYYGGFLIQARFELIPAA